MVKGNVYTTKQRQNKSGGKLVAPLYWEISVTCSYCETHHFLKRQPVSVTINICCILARWPGQLCNLSKGLIFQQSKKEKREKRN